MKKKLETILERPQGRFSLGIRKRKRDSLLEESKVQRGKGKALDPLLHEIKDTLTIANPGDRFFGERPISLKEKVEGQAIRP
jgi:hypothetical protein